MSTCSERLAHVIKEIPFQSSREATNAAAPPVPQNGGLTFPKAAPRVLQHVVRISAIPANPDPRAPPIELPNIVSAVADQEYDRLP